MADIFIYCGQFGSADGVPTLYGYAHCSPQSDAPIYWEVPVSWNDTATQINAALKAAAIAAADLAGFTVGMLDKKTLFGGAVGL